MIQNVYAIFDHAVKAFLPPFCLRNDGQAIRTFTDCVNSQNHQFHEHPEDYNLFLIGTFDDSLAEFKNLEPAPKNLGSGLALLRRAPSTPAQIELLNQPPVSNGADKELR